MNSREAYIALNMIQGIGPVSVRSLVSTLGSPETILKADRKDLMSAPGVGPELATKILDQRTHLDVDKELRQAEKRGVRLVTALDEEYPKRLREIYDPPMALYVWGMLDPRDSHAVAVVGSRRTTHYGLATAEMLSCQLAQAGFTVVSGLARGIDTAAHRGALKGKGRTIAVLGGGLDRLYPEENADLAKAIAGQGAVLTEFPFGREPDKTTFPIRNRIVSGLSEGVVVVEAGLTSGAMITANEAAEQGRTVFAVPGRIDSPTSGGCHRLIKNGARLTESVDDILEELGQLIRSAGPTPGAEGAIPLAREKAMPSLSGDEAALVKALEDEEKLDVDTLTRLSGLKPAAVNVALIGLEMKRMVRMLPGRIVELRR